MIIWIMLALEIITLISSYMQYELLRAVERGDFVSDAAIYANDLREMMIAIIYFIANIMSIVLFIMWFRRAYFNLHQMVGHLRFSDGWAAGSWFVPVIGLYRPYQIMKEIYVETKAILTNRGFSQKVGYSTGILGLWWTLFLVNSFLCGIIFRISLHDEGTIDYYLLLTVMGMASNIIGIPLALVAVKVVKDYSKVEPLLTKIDGHAPQTSI